MSLALRVGMEMLADLARLVRLLLAPLAKQVLVAAPVVLFVASSSRTGCSKEKAYLTAMRSDLRQIAAVQEARHVGRAAAELAGRSDAIRASTGVVLVSMRFVAGGFDARVAYPGGTSKECWIEHRWGQQAEPRCDA